MEKIELNAFLSQIQRLPAKEVSKLLKEYTEELDKQPFNVSNRILNYVEQKMNIVAAWRDSREATIDLMCLKTVTEKVIRISNGAFDVIRDFNSHHPTIQIEEINQLTETERYYLLKNYGSKLSSIAIQNLVIVLDSNHQKEMMVQYKEQILKTEFKELVTFVACLKENQREFLLCIEESIQSFSCQEMLDFMFALSKENTELYLKQNESKINQLEKDQFIELLAHIKEDLLIPFSIMYKEKFCSIQSSVLMYKLGMEITDSKQLYLIWSLYPEKLNELNDTYFNLIISRFDDTERFNSLTDFKERYNRMDTEALLSLFALDSNEMKVELLIQYHDKIKTLGGRKIIDYINQTIYDRNARNQLFLLYKSTIANLVDADFIYFVDQFSNENLGYIYTSEGNSEQIKKEMVSFLIDTFKERIRNIKSKNIPELFSNSDTLLQHEYLGLLEQKIKVLIDQRTNLEALLKAIWGENTTVQLYERYKENFKKLTAIDWYNLRDTVDPKQISSFLLKCEIDNFDFVDKKELNTPKIRKMFSLMQENLRKKTAEKSKRQLNKNPEQVLKDYQELVFQVCEDDSDSLILNSKWQELMSLLKILLERHYIDTSDDYYQILKEYSIDHIISKLEIEDEKNIDSLANRLFYRLATGKIDSLDLLDIKTLKGLLFLNENRIGRDSKDLSLYSPREIEAFVEKLTENQVVHFNQKHFKKVCERLQTVYKKDCPTKDSIRNLAIHLYLSVGYEKAMKIIDPEIPFQRYEYIFEGIDLKRIQLDETGNPSIPKKLRNFMFGSNMEDINTNINRLLRNQIPEFEKQFASIYNSWDIIYLELNGTVTIQRILKWFEENKVILNPDEYPLTPYLKEFQSHEIETARDLYSDMKKRTFSTIPKVSGSTENYTYEILDLDDPLGLAVGYITRCCFLITGESRSSLFHSAQSKDGRIFIVRNQGELIAQSWVWRNGNLVCFDNAETRGNYSNDELGMAYRDAAEKIILISAKNENAKEQIKMVTIGGSYSRITLPEEQVPEDKIELPRVENPIYTDAHNQYILAASEKKGLYYGDVKAEYQDERKKVEHIESSTSLDPDQKVKIIKMIQAIDYLKSGTVTSVNLEEYSYMMFGEDWYLLITGTGAVEMEMLSTDEKAKSELLMEICKLEERLVGIGASIDPAKTKQKALNCLTGGEVYGN